MTASVRPCVGRTLPVFSGIQSIWANAIGSTGPDDVWIVGNAGIILHLTDAQGKRFQRVNSPVTKDLYSVFALTKSAVWVGGERGALLFSSGGAFTVVNVDVAGFDAADTLAIWAFGEDDVIASNNQMVVHFDGAKWQKLTIPSKSPDAIFAFSASDVWVSDTRGAWHWNGTTSECDVDRMRGDVPGSSRMRDFSQLRNVRRTACTLSLATVRGANGNNRCEVEAT